MAASFVVSREANKIYNGFINYLHEKNAYDEFVLSLKNSKRDIEGTFYLVKEWINAYRLDDLDNLELIDLDDGEIYEILDEVIVIIIENEANIGRLVSVDTKTTLEGLVGTHKLIIEGKYKLSYTGFINKLKE